MSHHSLHQRARRAPHVTQKIAPLPTLGDASAIYPRSSWDSALISLPLPRAPSVNSSNDGSLSVRSSIRDAPAGSRSSDTSVESLGAAGIISSPLDPLVTGNVLPWNLDRASQLKEYDLPCTFEFTGCSLRFHPSRYEDWIKHTNIHFGGIAPPPFSCCGFCDAEFFDKNGLEPSIAWRERMIHIAGHFANGAGTSELRPDFWLLEYMCTNDLVSANDYAWYMRYTERPSPNDLIQSIEERRLVARVRGRESREDRSTAIHDLAKEKRTLRRIREKKPRSKPQAPKSTSWDARALSLDSCLPRVVIHDNRGSPKNFYDNGPKAGSVTETGSEDHISFPEIDESTRSPLSSLEQVSSIDRRPHSANKDSSYAGSLVTLDLGPVQAAIDQLWTSSYLSDSFNLPIFTTRLAKLLASVRFVDGGGQPHAKSCQTGTNQSSSSGTSPSLLTGNSPNDSQRAKTSKRGRLDQDGSGDDAEDSSRHPGGGPEPSSPDNLEQVVLKYTCPYRKNNPCKYNLANSEWKICATTPFPDVARVKEHLYSKHYIPQCGRCKFVYNSQQGLDVHRNAEQGCRLTSAEPLDGVTPAMKDELRSRKAPKGGWTKGQAWQKVYKICFPKATDCVSPYFVPVSDIDLGNFETSVVRQLTGLIDLHRGESGNSALEMLTESAIREMVGKSIASSVPSVETQPLVAVQSSTSYKTSLTNQATERWLHSNPTSITQQRLSIPMRDSTSVPMVQDARIIARSELSDDSSNLLDREASTSHQLSSKSSVYPDPQPQQASATLQDSKPSELFADTTTVGDQHSSTSSQWGHTANFANHNTTNNPDLEGLDYNAEWDEIFGLLFSR